MVPVVVLVMVAVLMVVFARIAVVTAVVGAVDVDVVLSVSPPSVYLHRPSAWHHPTTHNPSQPSETLCNTSSQTSEASCTSTSPKKNFLQVPSIFSLCSHSPFFVVTTLRLDKASASDRAQYTLKNRTNEVEHHAHNCGKGTERKMLPATIVTLHPAQCNTHVFTPQPNFRHCRPMQQLNILITWF